MARPLRNLLQRGLAIAAMVLFVAAGSLPVLWRMDCLSSGKVKVAWISIKPCCHPEQPVEGAQLKHHCCDYSHFQPTGQEVVKEDRASLSIHQPAVPLLFALAAPDDRVTPGFNTLKGAGPPPRSTIERLIAISTFRV